MVIIGTSEGAYRLPDPTSREAEDVEKVLDTPRVERVRRFNAVDGVFAATTTGLYYSATGATWQNLGVPTETVWAVTVSPTGDFIYAGSRPTHVYRARLPDDGPSPAKALNWRELEEFRELPGWEDWGVPRHDDKAQVRDLCIHPASPARIVVGVEPAGVHVSPDRGDTWEPRRDGVHEDVHALHVVADGEYVAATGRGLYRTTDAGHSWNRLDEEFDQRYFRTAAHYDGVLYASGACVPPSERWETAAADPALFACRDGTTLKQIDAPYPDEVVVGWTAVDDTLVGVTHRGKVFQKAGDRWQSICEVPSPDTIPGCYYNLA
jgi:hypothetical protein